MMGQDVYLDVERALLLIKKGNGEGIDLIFTLMGKPMLFVAKGIVKDESLAQDVLQDTFIKIIENISKYKEGTNGYSWIMTIVRNTSLNYINKSNYKNEVIYDEIDILLNEEKQDDHTSLLVKQIFDSIDDPLKKEMIYLKYFLDYSVRDISKVVNKSKSYVAKEINKTEEFLKNKFNLVDKK